MPPWIGCACASVKPGTSSPPCRSTVAAPAPGPLPGLRAADGEDRAVAYDDDAVRVVDTEHPAAGEHEVGHASSTYVRGTRAPIRVTIS